MFFQVLVSNNHWNLLHFLWWQDRGLWKESVDHERCVYVFGTSSPSCSNYVLKRTFTDGKDQFGLEATKTLQNNFYVDDLQKSVAEEDQAIQLRENVHQEVSSWQFLSNNKRVLQSIPALEVLWNTETDNFEFKVTSPWNRNQWPEEDYCQLLV